MTPSARLSAAIEVLDAIGAQRRPAADAIKDWGLSHRFAGSKDRAAIAALVYDALRVRASAAWIMGEDSSRAVALGALRSARGMDAAAVAALCSGADYAPAPLSEQERGRLERADPLASAPDHVRGDYPEWLAPAFDAAFDGQAAAEGHALAQRAPVDLRVNLLKTTRDKALAALSDLGLEPTPLSPWGLRIAPSADGRAPALGAEPAYAKGRVEIQDEGSQLAALLTCAQPGWQVLDLCAGAGGQSLALAAMMTNKGQIYATDEDSRRLAPIYDRLARAGARNVQVRPQRAGQRADHDAIADLVGRCDLVLVDAPCSGSGAWRRNPDAKWRVRPSSLETRMAQQDAALARASAFVKTGGALVYVTCSVLREENEERVAAFLAAQPGFLPMDAAHMAKRAGAPQLAGHASRFGAGLRLSPHATATDGFYVAGLLRS